MTGGTDATPAPPDPAGVAGATPGAGVAPDVLELRPPKVPAQMVLFIATGSAVLAVGGIATGQVLLGVVALLSAGWLGSMAYVSLTAWARADADGIAAHWVRTTQAVRWDQMAELEVDRRAPHGALRSVEAVRIDGAAARWAPWYPFLWYTHHSVSVSLDVLTAAAEARGVPVNVLTRPAPADR